MYKKRIPSILKHPDNRAGGVLNVCLCGSGAR